MERQFWDLGAPFVHRPPDLLWAAIGLITLVATAALVRRRSLSDVESTVLRLVNGWPGWLFPPMQLLQLGGILVAGPIVALGAAAFRRYRLALALLLATGLKYALERVVKLVVHRQRPGAVDPSIILRGDVEHRGLSFVSGHAVLVVAMAVLISPYVRGPWKAVPWTLVALICIARLYLGAHFPLDLVGGAGLGLFIGATLNFAFGVPSGG